jgi:hypothetical protein
VPQPLLVTISSAVARSEVKMSDDLLTAASSQRQSSKADVLWPPTSWSLLAAAARPDGVNRAVDEFAERYYSAVRSFVAAIVRDREESRDLTQKFFLTVVIKGRLFQAAERQKGSFRLFLKQTIRNFLVDEHRYQIRKKRQNAQSDLHPDGLPGGWGSLVHKSLPSHDQAFLRGWAQDLVKVGIERVWRACKDKGQQEHFRVFAGRFLSSSDETPSWRQLGERFGLDEKTARSRADTVARRLKKVIRELIETEVGSADRTDNEIFDLISLF